MGHSPNDLGAPQRFGAAEFRLNEEVLAEIEAFLRPEQYPWHDAGWHGVAQKDLVFFELHVGAFTAEGTFQAAQQRLAYLKELGIRCAI